MTKRVAYFVQHDISKNDGVTKKIKSQTDAWRERGLDVEIFCVVPNIEKSILRARQFKSSGYIRQRIELNKELLEDISRFSPDVVYFRYDTWSRNLSRLSRNYKIVIELNTLDVEEFKLLARKEGTIKSWARYFAYKLLRRKVIAKAEALVSVTHEILHHKSNSVLSKKGLVVPNSIALADYPVVKVAGKQGDIPELFFIGTPGQPWHGVDIIEDMARNLPHCIFHIVGINAPNKQNVYYHGYLPQSKYIPILRKCHICIGSLAMYRNNMSEACPLKVREYLSYGFPVVVGYSDTAFMGEVCPSWLHKMDRDIDYASLARFIEFSKNVVVSHTELDPISVVHNEKRRVEFLLDV